MKVAKKMKTKSAGGSGAAADGAAADNDWQAQVGSVLDKLRVWAEQNVVPVQKDQFTSSIIAPLEAALGKTAEEESGGAAMGAFAAKKAAMKLKKKLPPATKEGGVAKGAFAAMKAAKKMKKKQLPPAAKAPEGGDAGAAMGAFAAKKAAMKLKKQLPPATKEGGVAKVQHNLNPTSHS